MTEVVPCIAVRLPAEGPKFGPFLIILMTVFWIFITGIIGSVIQLRSVSKREDHSFTEWLANRKAGQMGGGDKLRDLSPRLELLEHAERRLRENPQHPDALGGQ